ncbi:MAG TPA: hypothetical protein VNA69_01110 [Thermoanaerobaculia bacterium]|nr:hypothetical protein [Thermoanaerobaculia bacterium]
MTRDRGVVVAIVAAVTGAIARLAQLGWLHPLNPDEREFFVAMRWIAEGRVPYRDFWEHHTPLTWFLFAPLTRVTESPGVDAVLLLRWAQIPIWIGTFWLANVWMRDAGLSRFARWSAMAFALCSSFFMLSAIEFRVDALGCLLIMAALVLMQRTGAGTAFAAGAAFCLAGFANLRFGPLILLSALLFRIVDTRGRAWRGTSRANWLFAGALVTLAASLAYFVVTGSLDELIEDVFRGNFLSGRYVPPILSAFLHRLLIPFGIRVLDAGEPWSAAAVDVGGIVVVVIGCIGLIRGLARWRNPDDLFVMAFVQAVNMLFIAAMNTIYNYHFLLVVVLMLPLIAMMIDLLPRRALVLVLLVVAWGVSVFASIFRGKELDLAYQDLILREAHARTRPGETIWSGIAWSLRRDAPHRLWFLPDMAAYLVHNGEEERYRLEDLVRNPPAALVVDNMAATWLSLVQRELAPYFIRHYVPLWRSLWIPGLNARLAPGESMVWMAPRDGEYRVYAGREIAGHPWFDRPLYIAHYQSTNIRWPLLTLPPPGNDPRLQWWIDRQPATVGASVALRKGQVIAVASSAGEPLGVILLPSADRTLNRQPPPGVTLEGVSTRVTHVPDFHARIE